MRRIFAIEFEHGWKQMVLYLNFNLVFAQENNRCYRFSFCPYFRRCLRNMFVYIACQNQFFSCLLICNVRAFPSISIIHLLAKLATLGNPRNNCLFAIASLHSNTFLYCNNTLLYFSIVHDGRLISKFYPTITYWWQTTRWVRDSLPTSFLTILQWYMRSNKCLANCQRRSSVPAFCRIKLNLKWDFISGLWAGPTIQPLIKRIIHNRDSPGNVRRRMYKARKIRRKNRIQCLRWDQLKTGPRNR